MRFILAALAAILGVGPALAQPSGVVSIDFRDGDTADNWIIENVAQCPGLEVGQISIDLSGAKMALIFDSKPGGAGYATGAGNAGTLQIMDGQAFVTDLTRLEDGGNTITIGLKNFGPASRIIMVLDVDDPNKGAAKGVAGDDAGGILLQGATAAATLVNAAGAEHAEQGVFGSDNGATIAWDAACTAPQ